MAGSVPLHKGREKSGQAFTAYLVACSMQKKGSLGEAASFPLPLELPELDCSRLNPSAGVKHVTVALFFRSSGMTDLEHCWF